LLLAGCTVLPIDEVAAVRARDDGKFDTDGFVAERWPARVMQELRARALPLDALREPVARLVARHGNRAGEGSPWTFVLRGEGVVRSIERDSPRGRMQVGTAAGPITIQTGPVVSGTTIRDALPSITFDDFPDQISFAEAGMAMTDKALARLRPTLAAVAVGDRVSFLGTASVAGDPSPLLLTPVELTLSDSSGSRR
jgi:predicted lipoprotein